MISKGFPASNIFRRWRHEWRMATADFCSLSILSQRIHPEHRIRLQLVGLLVIAERHPAARFLVHDHQRLAVELVRCQGLVGGIQAVDEKFTFNLDQQDAVPLASSLHLHHEIREVPFTVRHNQADRMGLAALVSIPPWVMRR